MIIISVTNTKHSRHSGGMLEGEDAEAVVLNFENDIVDVRELIVLEVAAAVAVLFTEELKLIFATTKAPSEGIDMVVVVAVLGGVSGPPSEVKLERTSFSRYGSPCGTLSEFLPSPTNIAFLKTQNEIPSRAKCVEGICIHEFEVMLYK